MTDFSCAVRVRSADGGPSRVSARRHQSVVGVPVSFDTEDAHASALECALGALGAEIVGGLGVFARRRRQALSQIEAVVTGSLTGSSTYLEVVGESDPPRISRVEVVVYVSSDHDQDSLRLLWDDTLARLPLVRAFRSAVALDVRVVFMP